MIKYFCNGCNRVISSKYTMQVLKPDGEKMASRHYCSNCWQKVIDSVVRVEGILDPSTSNIDTETSEELNPVLDNTQDKPATGLYPGHKPSAVVPTANNEPMANVVVKGPTWFFKDKATVTQLDARMKPELLQRVLAYVYTHPTDNDSVVSKHTGVTYASVNSWHSKYYREDRKDLVESIKNVICDGTSVPLKDILLFVAAGRDDAWISGELGIREDFVLLVKCYYTGIVSGYLSFRDFVDKTDELIV